MYNQPDSALRKCVICGKPFPDMGSHPLTCGQRDCALKASKIGWRKLLAKRIKDAGLASHRDELVS